MKDSLAALFTLVCLVSGAAPAQAYCVINHTTKPLIATMSSYSPLGKFQKEIRPGGKACCDWFDRGCNPTGTRDALVTFEIEALTPPPPVMEDQPDEGSGRSVLEDVDRLLGQRRDSFGNTLKKRNAQDFRRDGRDADARPGQSRNRQGRPVVRRRGNSQATQDDQGGNGAQSPGATAFGGTNDLYCSTGLQRNVQTTGGGTITVTESSLSRGRLRCESRDHFLRPVKSGSTGSSLGVPMLRVPPQTPLRSQRRR